MIVMCSYMFNGSSSSFLCTQAGVLSSLPKVIRPAFSPFTSNLEETWRNTHPVLPFHPAFFKTLAYPAAIKTPFKGPRHSSSDSRDSGDSSDSSNSSDWGHSGSNQGVLLGGLGHLVDTQRSSETRTRSGGEKEGNQRDIAAFNNTRIVVY